MSKVYAYIWKILHFINLIGKPCLPPALEAQFPIFLAVRTQAPELRSTSGKFIPVFEPKTAL